MNKKQQTMLGVGAIGAAALLTANDEDVTTGNQALDQTAADAASVIERWSPVSEGGEVGIDSLTGVVYDDPEEGEFNDEPEDDPNTSFETVNTNETTADDTDPTSYAPDTETSLAPEGGVIADAGDSQNFGTAGEQENDDLTERSADSELDDSQKAAFDRYANYDTVED